MFFSLLILTTALSVSAIAGYYSIIGLATIFSAAFIPVVIMGSALEVGKLVTVSYLHRYWNNINFLLKTYLVFAVLLLMFITSMGIFGFLSKAHIDQTSGAADNTIRIERLQSQIEREQRVIRDAEQVLIQLDETVNTLIEFDRIRGKSGAIATRESQKGERDDLQRIISQSEGQIDSLQEQVEGLDLQQNQLEAEVGPIKYIAEFVYGDADKNVLEEAVRWVIIVIVSVFDPLAVALLVAWNSIHVQGTKREIEQMDDEEIFKNFNEQPIKDRTDPPKIPEELKQQGYFFHAATKKIKKRQT